MFYEKSRATGRARREFIVCGEVKYFTSRPTFPTRKDAFALDNQRRKRMTTGFEKEVKSLLSLNPNFPPLSIDG